MLHDIIAIETELNRLDVSQSTVCALTGIAAGSLSDIIRGVKKAGFEQEQAIYKALEGLHQLIEAVRPLQLDFKKTLQLKQQIELLQAGRLQISIVIQEPRRAPEPQYNIFLGNQGWYFVRRAKNVLGSLKIVGSYQSSSGAVRVSKECGDQLVAVLTQSGHKAQLIKSSSTDEDGAYDNFEALWGSLDETLAEKI